LSEDLVVVMRVYFEKPRTTVGWKGMINDPDLNNTFNVNKGLREARTLLRDVNALGMPAATEFLDAVSQGYISDFISWGAIGARTTESQCHREMSSGLNMPIGFKNSTSGDLQVAVDAIGAALNGHSYLSVSPDGSAAIATSAGNPHSHIILRGGKGITNYDAEAVKTTEAALTKAGCAHQIVIDCSHANSFKKHENQPKVAADIAAQIATGTRSVRGVMIESNIVEGGQKLSPGKTDPSTLTYGQSVTDACIGWDTTVDVLQSLAAAVRARRNL
jgi:3-deoxy-7-phosphoheptulonate synthase